MRAPVAVLVSLIALPCLAADPPDAVSRAVHATYIHGVTRAIAQEALPPGAEPALLARLDDPACTRRDNVVAFLAHVGGPDATARLLAFLERERGVAAARRTPEDDRAYLLAPQAVGLIAGRGDDAAFNALLALARDGRAPRDLRAMALRGLGWSGRADARRALAGFVSRGTRRPGAASLRRSAAQALALHDEVRGGGVPEVAREGVPFATGRAPDPGARYPADVGAGHGVPADPADPANPTHGAAAPPVLPLVPDPAPGAHEHGLSYANHVDLGPNEALPEGYADWMLRTASRVAAWAEFDADVACCTRLVRSGSARTFGSASDGLVEIDDDADLTTVLDDPAGRVKVVRAINWCGSPGMNIIGCAYLGGRGMAVVRYTYEEATLWLHEYGHNLGLPHVGDARYVMHAYLDGQNRGLYARECAAFHDPPAGAAALISEAGACTDGDGDGYQDFIDNCPGVANYQDDYDGDAVGDVCDNCRWTSNPGQENPDADAPGSACDNCPEVSNGDQYDRDYDGSGDACDACPQESPNDADRDGLCAPPDNCRWERNPDQADADVDGLGDRCDLCPADSGNDGDRDGLCGDHDNCPGVANAPPWFTLSSPVGGFGRAAAGIGDVNGDGHDDLLVGAPGYDAPSSPSYDDRGAAYVYLGAPGGYEPEPAWSRVGAAPGAQFGARVAAAGDVNGDRRPDLLVASSAPDGLVELFCGTGTGVQADASWSVRRTGTADRFGSALAAGDVNADGYSDILVAAPGQYGSIPARVYVYLGGPDGPASQADLVLEPPDAGWNGFATSVAVPGDMDGDGYGEVAVGAPNLSPRAGVYVWFGSSAGPAGAPLLLTGDRPESQFGYAVAPAGDVNGDGRPDLLVGDPRWSRAPAGAFSSPSEEGGVYIFYGLPSRRPPEAGATAGGVGRRRAAERRRGESRIPLRPGWSYGHVGMMYGRFGAALAPAGDLDGDGYADVAVGTRWEGAYVFLGSRTGPGAWPAWHARSPQLYLGPLVTGAGDADGDGRADLVIGNAPDSNYVSGHLWVYRGGLAGIDAPQADADGDGTGDACDVTP